LNPGLPLISIDTKLLFPLTDSNRPLSPASSNLFSLMSMCLMYSSYCIQDPRPQRNMSVRLFFQRMMLFKPMRSMFSGYSPLRPADQILLSLHSVCCWRSFMISDDIGFPNPLSERSSVLIDSFIPIGVTSNLENPDYVKWHLIIESLSKCFDFEIYVPS